MENEGTQAESTQQGGDDSTFTPEQFKALKESVAKLELNNKALLEEKRAAEKREKEAQKVRDEAEKAKLSEQGKFQELLELEKTQREKEKMLNMERENSLRRTLADLTIKQKISALAAEHKAVDVDAVLDGLSGAASLNDDGSLQINAEFLRSKRIDPNGMDSLEKIVPAFLSERSYLVQSPNGNGAGTRQTPANVANVNLSSLKTQWESLSAEQKRAASNDPTIMAQAKAAYSPKE